MLVFITLFAPLFGALFASMFVFSAKNLVVSIVAILSIAVSLVCAIMVSFQVGGGEILSINLFDWIVAGEFGVSFGFMLDSVGVVMALVVLSVSLCVFIYSVGYMSEDSGFNKFFSYLCAFVFSMLVLVMSDNFLGLFIGWEGVGLCSWLLIGFWYKKDSASFAANEAFIMNRIADLAMLLGIFAIYAMFGTLKYSEVFQTLSFGALDIFSLGALSIIGILLFIGAMGKSAQFPLHTWLADAMEGPTPVSALIHAATMVTAGVYLIIRAYPIYSMIEGVGLMIAYLGAFVAVFAASMALVNRDLKRIIAYSTLSQLGYMFVAAGLGFYWIALFHLATHAFFKSLLFLGAGNVMHAMGDKLDIFKMGGLYKPLRFTAILMCVASLALCGIYPFAGFFSKDKILEVAFMSENLTLFVMLLIGAFMTAFYSFRLLMLVFFTPKRYEDSTHPHEARRFMLFAMLPLGILAVIAGFFESGFHHFVSDYLPSASVELDSTMLVILISIALGVSICGILLSIVLYRRFGAEKKTNFLHKILLKEYYIPQFYKSFIMKPYKALGAFFWKDIDLKIIDFMVDLVAKITLFCGESLRKIQSGNLSNYLIIAISGLFALIFAIFAF